MRHEAIMDDILDRKDAIGLKERDLQQSAVENGRVLKEGPDITM